LLNSLLRPGTPESLDPAALSSGTPSVHIRTSWARNRTGGIRNPGQIRRKRVHASGSLVAI
jgi:hypothetical protein